MEAAQNSHYQKGFTLIELLIVICIIAILSGILTTLIKSEEYRKQARDASRLNTILTLQTAILGALANSDISLTNTSICDKCNSYTGTLSVNGSGWVMFTDITGTGLKKLIQKLPKDPLNTHTHNFSYFSDGINFELNTVLESEKYRVNAQKDGGNDTFVYERGTSLNIN